MVFNRIISSVKYRLLRRRLRLVECPDGIEVTLGQVRIKVRIAPTERDVQLHEFHKIVVEDCYRLSDLREISQVVDVGANLGFFALACQRFFPGSHVSCFEPNRDIFPLLTGNTSDFCINAENCAVGFNAGVIELSRQANSLHSIARESAGQGIPKIAFSSITGRHDIVHLVKLDCEGAEWEILEDVAAWQNVRNLTMEYHLWAKTGAVVDDVVLAVRKCGLQVIDILPSVNGPFGMLYATRPTY